MKKRVELLIVIATLFLLVLGSAAFAVDKSDAVTGASLTVSDSGRFTSTTPGSTGAQGGNVTIVNVTTSRSTVKWAGFFGRVSAALKLGFGTDVLYDFGNGNSSQIKTVFASPDSAFNFGNLVNATTTSVDSAWGFPQGHVDSATRTFTVSDQTVAQVSNVKAVALNAYSPGFGFPGNASTLTTNVYNSSIFADNVTPVSTFDFAFGTKVVLDQRDFRNQTTVDYELVVPVNTSGLGGVQTYYFFLDVE